jgi:methylmalonyl-CoA mutase N-terminal domain/subunit
LKVDLSVGERQKEKLKAIKAQRDEAVVAEYLREIKGACEGDENVMPLILNAVKAYATLGEICGVMRDVFGEYQQSVNL